MKAAAATLLAAALLAAPAAAQERGTAPGDTVRTEHVTARLVGERIALKPGATAWLGLHFTIRAGWHTYWLNPGDAGEKTEIALTLPAGYTAGAVQWPAPQRLNEGPGIAIYGYTGTVLHLLPVTVPASAKPGETVTVDAEANWLVCEKICVPESGKFRVAVPVAPAAGDPPVDGRWADAFDAARAETPKPLPWTARYELRGSEVVLRVEGAALDPARIASIDFFPAEARSIVHATAQKIAYDAKGFTLTTAAGADLAKLGALDGILVVREKLDSGTITQVFTLAAKPGAATPGAGAPMAGATESVSLPLALLFALLGGMLLNLMPCVFPVLSMKALAFAAHGHAGSMKRHGLAYTAGVLALFGIIGAVLVALKAAGAEIGWGFQLQEPLFVLALAYLTFAIGLNLSGVFEIGGAFTGAGQSLTQRQGLPGAFFTGALAAVVATPCTAPFMGAALGYALAQPAPQALAVVLALGLGMALPFLALSCSPRLLRLLPRPGPWMERFKQILAFPMYGTAAWLVWVLSVQAGDTALLAALAGAVLIAFALWLWSVSRHAAGRPRSIGLAFALLALAGVGMLAAGVDRGAAAGPQVATADARWQPFDPDKLAALRREGKPVFVNFTAAWCVTCLVNERAALRSDAVFAAMKRKGMVAMKADWTRRDPAITRALAEFGRNGVPLYVVYPAALSDRAPSVLPQVLTEGTVLAEIELYPDAAAARTGQ